MEKQIDMDGVFILNQILIIERLTWSIYRLHDSCHLDQLIEHLIEEY